MAQSDRLLAAIEAEIKNISKLEHTLARTKLVLQEQASRLRLGTNPELVMTSLHPGVTGEQAREATGWALRLSAAPGTTEAPSARELATLRSLRTVED